MRTIGVRYHKYSITPEEPKITANFIQKIEKRKLPFNDFLITKATAPPLYIQPSPKSCY